MVLELVVGMGIGFGIGYGLDRLFGTIPIFLRPTRNHLGIIGPISREEFEPENIRRKIEANPLVHCGSCG